MNNQELLRQLQAIGRLPPSDTTESADFPLKEFDDLLLQFTVPLDFDTAVQLINLSPPAGKSCYEVEWAIVHLAETAEISQLQQVLDQSEDGEVKRIIQKRLDNYYKQAK